MDATTVEELPRPEAGGSGDGGGPLPVSDTNPGLDGPGTVLSGRWRRAVALCIGIAVVAGVVLRFWTKSDLWLDEALTVNISRRPLHEIPAYLKRDGAPPLYYVLLHFWMKIVGNGNLAVRSLSGLFSVLTLPVAYLAGRRYGGRTVGWVTLVLVASAPFAIYYATEVRMYSLVMFLVACGYLALDRVRRAPKVGNVVASSLAAAALLYTQYWAIYLLAAVGISLVWQAWRGPIEDRRGIRFALLALVLGGVAFLPWFPTFLYQSAHTGTPWSKPPNFAAIINAVTGFTDNQATLSTAGSNQGRLLAVLYFALGALALFGVARDRWHIDLDIRTQRHGRGVTFVVVFTLAAAITGGILTGSAYSPRYASVIFIPLLMLVAFGTLTLADARVRVVIVAVMAVAGLAAGVENIWTQRTQAPAIAAAVNAHAAPGDLVVYCPDQLGPAVSRLTDSGFDQVTFPRGTPPQYVNWVDYKTVVSRANAATFASHLEAEAGTQHSIWLVSSPGYQGYGIKCEQLAGYLAQAPGYGAHQFVNTNPDRYYEPMQLTEFKPPATSTPSNSATP